MTADIAQELLALADQYMLENLKRLAQVCTVAWISSGTGLVCHGLYK